MKVIVFAGTTEGYSIADFLSRHKVPSLICTATEYGASLIREDPSTTVRCGRMGPEEIESLFRAERPRIVIDATHPYAGEATGNIRTACRNTGISCCRILREESRKTEDAVYVESAEEAVRYLKETEGRILLTTGSKDLKTYAQLPDFGERIYARVLPLPSVLQTCQELGFPVSHLIGLQGPFSVEMNAAMLKQYQCRFLVTKDSGISGGFPEKTEAARKCGVTAVIIGRPLKEKGMTVFECRKLLADLFQLQLKPEITLAGIGMGSPMTLTQEAKEACESADLIIGAQRIADAVRFPGQKFLYEYRSEKIAEFIREHPEYERITVVLSGDSGFCSGARKLRELLGGNTRMICGISSVSYFMARIGMAWDDTVLLSQHGRECNLIGEIRENRKVFTLLGSADGVRNLAKKLDCYGMGDVLLYVGERLSYPDETIFVKKAAELCDHKGDPLGVLLAVNENAGKKICTAAIADHELIRDKVPMTKEEIRMVSIGKLRICEDSVCYDIGAGTGSVSVEMARLAGKGVVYAVEKEPDAICLIENNRIRFCVDNLHTVSGTAPDALEALPVPTHVFVGGTSGHMKEILYAVLKKNPDVRIVINCITLETMKEVLDLAEELDFQTSEIVQISAARAKRAGRYHMMTGENPVYVMTFQYPGCFSAQEEKE